MPKSRKNISDAGAVCAFTALSLENTMSAKNEYNIIKLSLCISVITRILPNQRRMNNL
jgi:hypothetical protein